LRQAVSLASATVGAVDVSMSRTTNFACSRSATGSVTTKRSQAQRVVGERRIRHRAVDLLQPADLHLIRIDAGRGEALRCDHAPVQVAGFVEELGRLAAGAGVGHHELGVAIGVGVERALEVLELRARVPARGRCDGSSVFMPHHNVRGCRNPHAPCERLGPGTAHSPASGAGASTPPLC
jgi:hypothetical protein